ncbi:uncharacterized protein LOC122243169 [Penaeus japonicus]|uniref:uncharacterized protein LOC122243169 n=1 Tax=Penaeus japonicus TaxID=27405 RepID=UPI001C717100|nr:uncharacterized protein LOC122243169 [Penaeus japonicus]
MAQDPSRPHSPWNTRPPVDPTPPWHTRPPVDPTPPWHTRPPIDPTPPWYTPLWPTKTPRPTRPALTPGWATKTPRPTWPGYTPGWATKTPRPTRPALTPGWATKTPRPTRPALTPGWATKTPRPTWPDYTPGWATKTPRPTRPALTPGWATKTPLPTLPTPTNAYTKRGCEKVCVDGNQNYYCCKDEKEGQCPAQATECSADARQRSVRESLPVCRLDRDCNGNRRCCFDTCRQDYVCTEVQAPIKRVVRNLESGNASYNQVSLTALLKEGSNVETSLLQRELAPLKNTLGQYLRLHLLLVPQGAGHSPFVNELLGCAEAHFKDQAPLLSFAGCVLTSGPLQRSDLTATKRCAGRYQLTWEAIHTCVTSGEGQQLVARTRDKDRHILQVVTEEEKDPRSENGAPAVVMDEVLLLEEASSGWLKDQVCGHLRLKNLSQDMHTAFVDLCSRGLGEQNVA